MDAQPTWMDWVASSRPSAKGNTHQSGSFSADFSSFANVSVRLEGNDAAV